MVNGDVWAGRLCRRRSGTDTLEIQADTGAILLGGTITTIETVQHTTNRSQTATSPPTCR